MQYCQLVYRLLYIRQVQCVARQAVCWSHPAGLFSSKVRVGLLGPLGCALLSISQLPLWMLL